VVLPLSSVGSPIVTQVRGRYSAATPSNNRRTVERQSALCAGRSGKGREGAAEKVRIFACEMTDPDADLPEEHLTEILLSQLTADEKDKGVAYASTETVEAGTQLRFPGVAIDVSGDAFLAFIDRNPMANWGHSSRHVLIDRQTGEVRSFEAQFPPFQQDKGRWRVAYKAPSVPDAVLAVSR
jgi:hypothetical protein